MRTFPRLATLAAWLLPAAAPALAQSGSADPFAALAAEAPPPVLQWQSDYAGMARVGINAVSDDSFMFGQYNGLHEAGATVTGDFTWDEWTESGGWSVTLLDLGLDTREGRARWVPAERLSLEFGFDSQRQVRNDSGRTPWTGDARLLLPASWSPGVVTGDFSALGEALRPFERELRRDSYFARVELALSESVSVHAGYEYRQRDGHGDIGAGFYIDAASADAALLPLPVDYEDQIVDLGLTFQGDALALQAGLEYSRFDSADAALSWQNPYSNYGPSVRYPDGFGALALPPDNRLLRATMDGVWRVASAWTLDFRGAMTRVEQDETFLPYSANPALNDVNALPADSLDGSHETATGEATLSWRPGGRIGAEFELYGRDRDYDTDRYGFNYVRGDAGVRSDPAFTVYNTAYDRRALGGEARVMVKLPKRSRLELAYGYERVERRNTAVEETEEDRYALVYRLRPTAALRARLELEWLDVAASTYRWDQSYFARLDAARINATPDTQRYSNHPLLTQFHLGNREELAASLRLDYLFGEAITLGGQLSWRERDYDASELGLTGRDEWRLAVDATYAPSTQQQITVYLNADRIESRQRGRAFRGGQEKNAFAVIPPLPQASDPARDWVQESRDRSLVAGVNWERQLRRDLSLSLDYSFVDTEALQAFARAPARLPVGDLPDVATRTHRLEASALWTLRPALSLEFAYRYFRHDDDDYAWAGLGPASLDKVLTFGQRNPDESIHFLEASVVYHLR